MKVDLTGGRFDAALFDMDGGSDGLASRVTGFTDASRFSPTINIAYKPCSGTVIHAGFARNFQLPNFQNVSSDIMKLFAGTTGALNTSRDGNTSPFAETDYTWDAGFNHRFTPHLAFAQDNYFRIDRHSLDEDSSGSFRLRRFELCARLRRRDRELNHIQPEELRGTRQRVRG
jgi:outer membrane receptor protein involved in Fe transport